MRFYRLSTSIGVFIRLWYRSCLFLQYVLKILNLYLLFVACDFTSLFDVGCEIYH